MATLLLGCWAWAQGWYGWRLQRGGGGSGGGGGAALWPVGQTRPPCMGKGMLDGGVGCCDGGESQGGPSADGGHFVARLEAGVGGGVAFGGGWLAQ